MVLTEEERGKAISFNSKHIVERLKERAHLFPHTESASAIMRECEDALRNKDRGIILPDHRGHSFSTHTLFFKNKSENMTSVPFTLNENNIYVRTVMDPWDDIFTCNWWVNDYNQIAEERGIPTEEKRYPTGDDIL